MADKDTGCEIARNEDKRIEKYIETYIKNAESISISELHENINLRFKTLDKKKYLVKRAVEFSIMRKLLEDDSDDEPVFKKSKRSMAEDDSDDEPLWNRTRKNQSETKQTTNNEDSASIMRKLLEDDSDDEPVFKKSKRSMAEDDSDDEPLWNRTRKNQSETKQTTNNEDSANSSNRSLGKSAEPNSTKKKSKTKELFRIGEVEAMIPNYVDLMGYVYAHNREKGTNLYLRCKNKAMHHCKASVVVRNGNFKEALTLRGHNHESVRKDLDRVKFNKKLEEICTKHPFITANCAYQRAKLELGKELVRKNIPPLKSVESLIYRLQKTEIPLLPKTVEDLERLILDTRYGKKYSHDMLGSIFYRGIWRGPTGANVPFVSESVLQQVRKGRHLQLLMDGTFKVLPLHIKFQQLYIINVIIRKRSYPLAFILMERKDTQSYELVLNEIKALISSKFRTVKCMTDYEAATRKALKKVYPEAEIHGCFFHYVQAITKRFKKFGLSNNKEKFEGVMQKISALALLPNEYVVLGFDYIAKDFGKSKAFARFEKYWRRQWANANISVYGLRNRTNNFAESLNKTINALIGRKHPHVWRLVHNLRFVEKDKSDELERVLDYDIIKVRKNKAMKELNSKIKYATAKFEKDLSIPKFLGRIVRQENFQMKFKERIFIDGVDEGREFDIDDDDEVIPNTFRKISNLKKP